jgi:hypothetical protein
MPGRMSEIIQATLERKGIVRYCITANYGEGRELPGHAEAGETIAEAGVVVTPERAYRFWMGWADGQYTMGEEDGSWHEVTPEEHPEEDWEEISRLQKKMRNDPEFGKHEPLVRPTRESGKLTGREELIIWWWLAPRFFNDYDLVGYDGPTFEVFDVQSGGHDLVGSLLPGEVQDISGIVVVAQGAFHFRLSWVWGPENVLYHHPGHYSLGEEDGSWRPVLREECTEEQWQQIQAAQQRLAQVFAQLPRNEHPGWRDLAEEEKRASEEKKESIAEMLRRRPRSERKPRIPRQIRRVPGPSQSEE